MVPGVCERHCFSMKLQTAMKGLLYILVQQSVQLYWLTSATFGLLQTWVLDYWDSRRPRVVAADTDHNVQANKSVPASTSPRSPRKQRKWYATELFYETTTTKVSNCETYCARMKIKSGWREPWVMLYMSFRGCLVTRSWSNMTSAESITTRNCGEELIVCVTVGPRPFGPNTRG